MQNIFMAGQAQLDPSKINIKPSQDALQSAISTTVPVPVYNFGISPRAPDHVFNDYKQAVNYYGMESNYETFLSAMFRLMRSLPANPQRLERDRAPEDGGMKPLGTPDLLSLTQRAPRANDFIRSPVGFEDSISRVKGWLGPDVLGNPELSRIFADSPPLFLAFSPQALGMFGPDGFGRALGLQFTNSNLIFLNTSAEMEGAPKDFIVLHETLHYLSYAGRQDMIYWEGGKPGKVPPAVLEGMNNYLAIQIFIENNPAQAAQLEAFAGKFYPAETRAMAALAGIVGRDALQKAFFTGDFTEVKQKFEAAGGNFEAFFLHGQFNQPVFSAEDRMAMLPVPTKK